MSGDPTEKMLDVASSALGEVVKLAKDSPDAREAGTYAARSLKIVAQTVHTVLLPLAAANYGFQRFADYMKHRFAPELDERLQAVPEEVIVPPRAVLAGPVLDSLVYAHEDDELRRLYLSLLAAGMDGRAAASAHPAFVEVLKQIDADEIGYLRAVLTEQNHWPIARVRIRYSDGAKIDAYRHVLDWREASAPLSPAMGAAYVENWQRLGLIEVSYATYLSAQDAYSWVASRPEMQQVEGEVSSLAPGNTVEEGRGTLDVTEWGRLFATTVRLADAPKDARVRELFDWRTLIPPRGDA